MGENWGIFPFFTRLPIKNSPLAPPALQQLSSGVVDTSPTPIFNIILI